VNAVGFTLSDLFLGGPGDYDVVESMYKDIPECQGQFWVQNGFEYRFTISTSTNQCGTMHSVTVSFFSCSIPINSTLSTNYKLLFSNKRFMNFYEVRRILLYESAVNAKMLIMLPSEKFLVC